MNSFNTLDPLLRITFRVYLSQRSLLVLLATMCCYIVIQSCLISCPLFRTLSPLFQLNGVSWERFGHGTVVLLEGYRMKLCLLLMWALPLLYW
jgi:hypothetical protein